MIARIHGVVLEKHAAEVLIDVQGLGYEVLVSLNTLFDVPEVGQTATLHTHFVVREDAQQLYGFSSREERTLFRHLIKVNGVGPKMALAILSGMNAVEFARCVQAGDSARLVKLPGVGKKTAERLLIEMRDKLGDISVSAPVTSSSSSGQTVDPAQEAETALIALGYKPQDAARMINRVHDGGENSAETLIRLALKNAL